MALREKCFACWVMIMIATIGLSAKTEPIQSRWQTDLLKIDGDSTDWMVPSFVTEKKAQVDYVFSNDEKNLYLLLIFKDASQSPTEQTGMTLWFNADGKTKKVLGLRFKKTMIPANTLIAIMEKKNGTMPEDKKKEIMSKPEYTVIHFMAVNKDDEDQTDILFKEMPRPLLQVKPTALGQFVYEFAFPLASLNKLGIEAGKPATIGFEWGGITKEMRQPAQPRGYQTSTKMPDQTDLDPRGSGPQVTELRRINGPKHYIFWCELALAAGK